MKNLIKQLYTLQADTYLLLIKTHGFHWNVKGIHFHSLHHFFEELYTEHFSAVDEIAEYIRARNRPALASHLEFGYYSKIKPGKSDLTDKEMIKDLIKSHNEIIDNLAILTRQAQKENDPTAADLANKRTEIHRKQLWMLNSHLS